MIRAANGCPCCIYVEVTMTHHDACSFFLIFMDRHSPFPFSEVIAGQARVRRKT